MDKNSALLPSRATQHQTKASQTRKLSDYVVDFLAKKGIRHVFAISGGASVHLIDSIAKHPDIDYICPNHEQAGAMAADAYSRVTGNMGAAISTSGPGATNMITGICCSYYDSVPVMYITGQVSTFRLKRDTGVRQMGFQETEIVEMCRPITKYAVQIKDPHDIRYELEKAWHIAKVGRPGPVLVDIPDNFQREIIDVSRLQPFVPPPQVVPAATDGGIIKKAVELLRQSERPVLIFGWGVYLAKAEEEARRLIKKLSVPTATTWGASDLISSDQPLFVGGFGSHGTRFANFTVQNADLVIVVGARLDSRASSPLSTFSRESRKIVVDIDEAELGKFKTLGLSVDLPVHSDAREFLKSLLKALEGCELPNIGAWKKRVLNWKTKYPTCLPEYYREKEVNPYVFVKSLSSAMKEGSQIFVDTGCALAWMMQGFEFKKGQRLFHDFNNTAMGYALPASIGASFALDKGPVVCITGDGSLLMNLQELSNVIFHKLPIKIFLINNQGHGMIQQTQDQWLGSRYEASSVKGHLAFPDFGEVAKAHGFPVVRISGNAAIAEGIQKILKIKGPAFCDVHIRSSHRVMPQVRFGRPIEDGEPFLSRKEFMENMIVPPHPSSLEGVDTSPKKADGRDTTRRNGHD